MTAAQDSAPAWQRRLVPGLFLVSGFTGLVFEVLWMKQLALLFGNTAQAAATTLAAFFLGLAAGGYVFGRRAGGMQKPLRGYALLEAGVAVSALAYFLLHDLYHAIYAPLFNSLGATSAQFVLVKFVLSVGVLFPPAFFMGGTLPLLSQHLVRSVERLGRTVPLLYAINTTGAALGAFAAGFYLPPVLGFRNAYLLAIGLTLSVALLAWWIAAQEKESRPAASEPDTPAGTASQPVLPSGAVATLAFVSGCLALALQVLWTRMFAQVLQNSVYTFAVILVTFLVCLALGAGLAAILARRRMDPGLLLAGLLVASALLVAVSPLLFDWVSDGMSYVGGDSLWAVYVLRIFGVAALIMLPPVVLLGSVFPYLMKISEATSTGVGRTVGNLVALNTAGAIVGSLLAGFVLLDLIGLWPSIRLAAAGYVAAALLVGVTQIRRGRLAPLAASVVALVLLAIAGTTTLPSVKLDDQGTERLLDVWEDSAATVAVIEKKLVSSDVDMPTTSLRIKVNNYYTLGGTAAQKWESFQTHLPLWLHAAPRSVYYLGMGTGITAGAALEHPVETVLVTEIVPSAVTAARRHFRPYVNGLFDDERARVVVEDGRNYLLGTTQRFDVIVADLFMPWKSGTGSLYTREHYQAARDRLTDDGLLVQWLPLYQMGGEEFGTIARTLLDVFPLVTVWRGDFFSAAPTVALIGHRHAAPLERDALQQRLASAGQPPSAETPLYHFVPDTPQLLQRQGVPPAAARLLLYYGGNLSAAAGLFDGYPVNTDDRPVIEYRAPITERRQSVEQGEWFAGSTLMAFLAQLAATAPAASDPYLARFSARERTLVSAGLQFHRAQVFEYLSKAAQAQTALRDFVSIVFPVAP